jgi:hypothetical protein
MTEVGKERDEKSRIQNRIRIRIRKSVLRIRRLGSVPVPKCQGSTTLVPAIEVENCILTDVSLEELDD